MPVDIGDNTIPNGNAVMLINLIRLGMMDEAKKLADSLNGYLNIYKSHMMTSLRAIDYFKNIMYHSDDIYTICSRQIWNKF